MPRMLTDAQSVKLAKLLIVMEVPKEMRLTILSSIETPQELLLFLDKLSEKNYEMTSQEVYQATVDTILETASISDA